jgi:hypothetical protein
MSRCSSAGFSATAAREKLRHLLIAAFGSALMSAQNADLRVRVAATH